MEGYQMLTFQAKKFFFPILPTKYLYNSKDNNNITILQLSEFKTR